MVVVRSWLSCVGFRWSGIGCRLSVSVVAHFFHFQCPALCTDKKENQISLIYKELQSGAVAKPYMRKGFLIYAEMRKYFPIYEEAGNHIWLWNCSILNFLIHEENLIFFFISVFLTLSCLWIYLRSFFSLFWLSVSVRLWFSYVSFCLSVSLCFILLSQLLQSLSMFFCVISVWQRQGVLYKGKEHRGRRRPKPSF